jgi:hypothetical protein
LRPEIDGFAKSGGPVVNRFFVSIRVVLSAAVLLWAAPAISQSFYGSVLSVIKDAQGGIVPGATVVLTNVATNERREGVSADDGTFRFVNLVPGTYRLEVELTGFQRFVREGIEVNVQATPRIEVTLAARQPGGNAHGHRRIAAAANTKRVGRHRRR